MELDILCTKILLLLTLEGRGIKIENGMVLAIEPMVNAGSYKINVKEDGWTIVTRDGKRSAHFEHSIAIVDGKPVILSEL